MSIILRFGLPMISCKLSKSVLCVYMVFVFVFSMVSVFSLTCNLCSGVVFPLFRLIWCIEATLGMPEEDLIRFLGAVGSEAWENTLVGCRDLTLFRPLPPTMLTSSRKFYAVIGMVSSPSGRHSISFFKFSFAKTSAFIFTPLFWVAEVARLTYRVFCGDGAIITVPSPLLSKVTSASPTLSLIYRS